MRRAPIGLVLPIAQSGPERQTPRWAEVRELALHAEAIGFDTVWLPDELLWLPEGKPPLGVWDGVSMLGAVAASTSTIGVGSWVLSALHRNPGITAKVVETLDEISGGRFMFGLGAGHAWPGQAHAFGLPETEVYARFDEALEIIVPLLRDGRADYEGRFHAAHGLLQQPVGPRPGRIPLMIGGNGPRMMRVAARHADIWSCYAEGASDAATLGPLIEKLLGACAEVGRDPATIGRSAGIDVAPGPRVADAPGVGAGARAGPTEELVEQMSALFDAGYTRLELWLHPASRQALDALRPVLEAFVAR
jgi:alkanesulfonate monooxygenase SsuD/methylene tetrahydromethanopterin reductase-like flavin-dependent oxidoreductase (luciferase family)